VKSRGGAPPNESQPKAADTQPPGAPGDFSAYTNAQLVDIGIADRAHRAERKSTRIMIGTFVVLLASLLTNVILASKDHTSALVYRDDDAGHRTALGLAGTNTTSSAATVESELRQWVAWVRDVPAGDVQLATLNQNDARLLVARGSVADQTMQALDNGPNAPAKLVKRQLNRLVVNQQVNKLTDLTYQIIWTERTFDSAGTPTSATYQGTVTLASAPIAPADPVYMQINPGGVFISSYNLEVPGS